MNKKILVIDDDGTMRTLLEFFLNTDYDVTSFSSAVEALEWLDSTIPDLIISDIEMEGMSGFDFVKEVRLRGFVKHTPIIMLSGKAESKERVKCYKLGAQDYLTKPFNPEELEELVKKNLFPIHYADQW